MKFFKPSEQSLPRGVRKPLFLPMSERRMELGVLLLQLLADVNLANIIGHS